MILANILSMIFNIQYSKTDYYQNQEVYRKFYYNRNFLIENKKMREKKEHSKALLSNVSKILQAIKI